MVDIRLVQNISLSRYTTINVLNSFKNIWKVSRNKKKIDFWRFYTCPGGHKMTYFRHILIFLKNVILSGLKNFQQQLYLEMWINHQNKHISSFSMSFHGQKSMENFKSYHLSTFGYFDWFEGDFHLYFTYFRGRYKNAENRFFFLFLLTFHMFLNELRTFMVV